MGLKIKVPERGILNLISQAYHAGGPYQWAREALVNSIQAESTWVHFGVDEQGFRKDGVARRFVADNGLGMNEDDLRIFLSSFGGGGRKISKTENFGQGFKASCYEWNPYGIVVMSWTPETPEGRMIWIRLDKAAQRWELKDFEFAYEREDGTTEYADALDCIRPRFIPDLNMDMSDFKFEEIEKAGHGTVFLFLGDSVTRDTVNGDYSRGEDSKRGIVGYLNSRFLDLPKDLKVRVSTMESKAEGSERRENKDVFVTSPSGERRTIHARNVLGVKAYIADTGTKHGELTVKYGTRIEWYLTEKDDLADGSYRPSKPMIAVQYDNEAYDRKDRLTNYRQFGIPDAVRNRVWLFIKPPKYRDEEPARWGVMPQASRGMLIGKGDTDLPWDDWQENFYAQLPAPIRDAIDASRVGPSEQDDGSRRDRLKRTMERLSTRWKPVALLQNDRGAISGTPSMSNTGEPRTGVGAARTGKSGVPATRTRSSDSGGGGSTIILNPDEHGELMGSERRRSEGIPNVHWDKFFDEDEIAHAARFDSRDVVDGSFGTIHFNLSFPMFQTEFAHWVEMYPRASPDEVLNVVKQVYEDELVSKVMHAHKMKGQILRSSDSDHPVRVGNDHVTAWTSAESLTASVLGLSNVEQRINVTAGSKFGAGKRRAKVGK